MSDMRFLTILFWGICAVFAGLNVYLMTMDVDTSPIAPKSEELTQPVPDFVRLLTAKPELTAAYPETLVRPLFRSTRRPAPSVKGGETAAAPQTLSPRLDAKLPEGLALIGILKRDSENKRALLRTNGALPGEWVGVGHSIGGWRLSRIDTDSVTFEAQGQKQSLKLFPVTQTAR